ncbi:MAG: TM2 domain-containing protein [Saprospiraceae bacterium]|nr:TM2 domain-containing protein [Saprospiraceae bacterium]MBK7787399.1 TM2 domain-containing protein [Saprospiraceae bacterium]MBK8109789.1 TM2 domain-containing protein [Saprospiraceae bacterium]
MKTKILVLLLFVFGAIGVTTASFPVNPTTSKTEITVNDNKTADQTISKNDATKNQTSVEEMTSPAAGGGKSQLIALILVILVGGLGIHRFYLGYTTIGIIQLLTAGGCGIWALIDLVRIITGDLKPKDGEYAEKL